MLCNCAILVCIEISLVLKMPSPPTTPTTPPTAPPTAPPLSSPHTQPGERSSSHAHHSQWMNFLLLFQRSCALSTSFFLFSFVCTVINRPENWCMTASRSRAIHTEDICMCINVYMNLFNHTHTHTHADTRLASIVTQLRPAAGVSNPAVCVLGGLERGGGSCWQASWQANRLAG